MLTYILYTSHTYSIYITYMLTYILYTSHIYSIYITYILTYILYTSHIYTHTILHKELAEKETEIMDTEKCHHLPAGDLGKLVVQLEG